MQAQDYLGALWSVGLRIPGTTEADIEQAILHKQIVRTWPMRGTLHFVAPEDARWMLKLLTPRIVAKAAGRYKQLELDEGVFAESRKIFLKYLKGRALTRNILKERLENEGIRTDESRGLHIFGRLSMDGFLCIGPREGKQQTFVLMDEWIPEGKRLQPDEALAQLTLRYFTSHGPAALHDFIWWSGLRVVDAKRGLESVRKRLQEIEVEGGTYFMKAGKLPPSVPPEIHLLSGFDEFLLGYTDRSAAIDIPHRQVMQPGSNGMFFSTIIYSGKVIGLWRREIKPDRVEIAANFFTTPTVEVKELFTNAANKYGNYLNLPVTVV
jgi:hypothetical protein